jgi:hypothetical protein
MRPTVSILDPSFRYVPSFATSVADTWRRAGWHPTIEEKRAPRGRYTARKDRVNAVLLTFAQQASIRR